MLQGQAFDSVIPAWSAGIQVDMDVSGSILANLDAGYPCRHDDLLNNLVATAISQLIFTKTRIATQKTSLHYRA